MFTFDIKRGDNPFAGPVQAFDGNLYGFTPTGGNFTGARLCPVGCGTIFRITSSGSLKTLYNFSSRANCLDGELPYGGLLLAINGNLYGTTGGGGTKGYGTVFRITPGGELTTLYNFCQQTNGLDGSGFISGLIQGGMECF